MDANHTEVKALLEGWRTAIHTRNIDELMRLYAEDAVYFDVVPPLQIRGAAAVRRNFLRWFDEWSSPIGQDIRDLDISTDGNVAVAHVLIRTSGTLKVGREVGYWVRATVGCRRSNGAWSITHEHVSLPVRLPSGTAAMDLVP